MTLNAEPSRLRPEVFRQDKAVGFSGQRQPQVMCPSGS
jgi:hypothetical protein